MREPRQNSERHSKVYRLAVPVLKSTQNLVISRVSCAGRAKKCTKKRELNLYFPIKHGFNEIWPCSMTRLLHLLSNHLLKNTLFSLKKNTFFREISEQLFAQLLKFDSSSSFRNISINKNNWIPYYIKYIVALGRTWNNSNINK